MRVAVLNFGINNIQSIVNALDYLSIPNDTLSSSSQLNIKEQSINEYYSHLILPGVGSFSEGMSLLKESGLSSLIEDFNGLNKPILGICLGMQVLSERGSEYTDTPGLGYMPGHVDRIQIESPLLLPHVGWNNVHILQETPLFRDIPNHTDFYFVHSYRYFDIPQENILASTTYGDEFPIAVQNNNFYGVQFHPEKSQKFGLQLIRNFVELC